MRRIKGWTVAGVWVLMVCLAATTAAAADQQVTLVGEINETYQLVTDNGDIYEVGINDAGNDLVENHIGHKVRVKGVFSLAEDGARIISVESFEVIAE